MTNAARSDNLSRFSNLSLKPYPEIREVPQRNQHGALQPAPPCTISAQSFPNNEVNHEFI
jgi:hypothetical protein